MHTDLTPDQQDQLRRLAVPFHPNDISWRVTNTTQDKSRGCVIPYGDQRAYTDRLNAIFSPAGWTRTYDVTTLSPVTRVKRDKTIQTGKVIVTCVVSIAGLGAHTGSGEMWADDDNAMTRAEAQAFKRACSCFGLGRYFYNFAEMWVDLDKFGKPKSVPTLAGRTAVCSSGKCTSNRRGPSTRAAATDAAGHERQTGSGSHTQDRGLSERRG